jgi:hypothetical protein
MDFIKLVKKVLLLEDPDHALFNGDVLRYNEPSARPFFVATVHFSDSKSSEPVLFYATNSFETHADLYWYAKEYIEAKIDPERIEQAQDIDSRWNCYPSSIKTRMKKSVENWNPTSKEPYEVKRSGRYANSSLDLPSGRYWIKDKKFLISMWKGSNKSIKKWINDVLPIWNPNNFPVLYQPVGAEYAQWIDGNKFLASSTPSQTSKESPETRQLQRQINKLLPQVHISTGVEKEKIKTQIRTLQNRIKTLTGETPSLEDNISSKGSYRLGQIAGKMPIAQMKALSQTSESLV